jgi:hypothetical protein
MRKRNNPGESKIMLCRPFTNAINNNHKQSSSTLEPSQSPDQHESWSFPVGRNVHDRSWGKRTTRKRVGTQKSTTWTAADFSILEKLGEGHFGSVFQAKFTSDGTVCARSRTATASMERGRHAEQDVRDDMGDDSSNNSFRGDDTRDDKGSAFPKYVALKRFCKSRIQQSHQRGSRALELLRREVNIHSQ